MVLLRRDLSSCLPNPPAREGRGGRVQRVNGGVHHVFSNKSFLPPANARNTWDLHMIGLQKSDQDTCCFCWVGRVRGVVRIARERKAGFCPITSKRGATVGVQTDGVRYTHLRNVWVPSLWRTFSRSRTGRMAPFFSFAGKRRVEAHMPGDPTNAYPGALQRHTVFGSKRWSRGAAHIKHTLGKLQEENAVSANRHSQAQV